MKISRNELMPGIWVTTVNSSKYKTDCLSINMLTQLSIENASQNAIIPYILRRGTTFSPDMKSISIRLENMYGTQIVPVVRKVGEIQCIGLYSSFPSSQYLPENIDILSQTASFVSEMLLNPKTRGGLFLKDIVENEKDKMIKNIKSIINDKGSYAIKRCIDEMCCYEDYSTGKFGTVETVEEINYTKLTKYYHTLISSSPIEIFYCGSSSEEDVLYALKNSFSSIPRGDINYDIGTDIRMNSINEEPRELVESKNVNQGKLVMGFRLGECMEDPDIAAIRVFNAVFGGCVTSKLFENVREKMSLCYYASSFVEFHKGLMFVSSGIDPANYTIAKSEILNQLNEIINGNITDHEFVSAKNCLISDMNGIDDSQAALEGYFLSNLINGLDITPEEMSDLISQVTKDEIIEIAKSVVLDEIYFMTTEESEDIEEEVPADE